MKKKIEECEEEGECNRLKEEIRDEERENKQQKHITTIIFLLFPSFLLIYPFLPILPSLPPSLPIPQNVLGTVRYLTL